MRFVHAGSTSAGRDEAASTTSVNVVCGAHVNFEVPTTLFPAGGTGGCGRPLLCNFALARSVVLSDRGDRCLDFLLALVLAVAALEEERERLRLLVS